MAERDPKPAAAARDRFVGNTDPDVAAALLRQLVKMLAREIAAEDHQAEQSREGGK